MDDFGGDHGRGGGTRPVVGDGVSSPSGLVLRVINDGREIALDRDLTIGRMVENDLVLADASVSARHCLLLRRPRGLVLYDCHSTNGSFVNGVRVECAEIRAGFLVVLGATHLRVLPGLGHVPGRWATPAPVAGLVARSTGLRQVLVQIQRLAPTRLPVLILGESGTGKELLARAVHALSPRAAGPFVAVNCSAIPSEVAESELFGHERGAFTGALAARPGVFEEASGGTLFLDEIGDLSPLLQPKLLRALESGLVRRVGGRGERPIDVRVVAATNRELSPREFRADLFHRLARGVLRVPPLRERTEDIAPLVEQFLADLSIEHGVRVLAPDALPALRGYSWPGNVRELRNAVERAVLMGGPVLRADEILDGARANLHGQTPSPAMLDELIADRTLEEIEREAISAALRRTAGNQRAAATLLGLARTTLGERARRYGLLPEQAKPAPRRGQPDVRDAGEPVWRSPNQRAGTRERV